MDAKAPFSPVETPSVTSAGPETEIILHPVARIPRDGFPVADSAEEVRGILETGDRACALGMRKEGTR
jgi:hypothetical protein